MLALETYHHQSTFANYCRTGELTEIKGIHQINIKQYRRLVYNVADDMLQSAFPITYNFLEQDEWDQLVNDFFSHHACQSPQVWYMPKEFYEYCSLSRALHKKYPFLLELLWFEWLEVELFMMEDKFADCIGKGSIYSDPLVLNPEHHFQHFHYPVHLRNPEEISASNKANYYLVLHRNPESGSVNFTQVSAPTLRILELLAEKPLTANQIFQQVCTELNLSIAEEMKNHVFDFFQNSLSAQLILGFKKQNCQKQRDSSQK